MSGLFVNEVHAFTFKTNSFFRKEKNALIDLRMSLRSAHRYVLDNTMLELMVRTSTNIDRLPAWMQLARLPYDKIWIEYDNHEKVRLINKFSKTIGDMDLDEVSPVIGCLLEQIPNTTAWTVRDFMKIGNDEIVVSPCYYVFDPDATKDNTVQNKIDHKNTLEHYIPSLSGLEYAGIGIITAGSDPHSIVIAPWFEYNIALCIDPLWKNKLDFSSKITKETIYVHMQEFRGNFRMLIAFLAMFNEVPTTTKDIPVDDKKKIIGGRGVSNLNSKMLSLSLPKIKNDRVLPWVTKKLSEGFTKRRQHSVRGHFRRFMDKKLGEERRIWISSHIRGNSEIGNIEQNVTVVKGRIN